MINRGGSATYAGRGEAFGAKEDKSNPNFGIEEKPFFLHINLSLRRRQFCFKQVINLSQLD
jgi:hypothetical protein